MNVDAVATLDFASSAVGVALKSLIALVVVLILGMAFLNRVTRTPLLDVAASLARVLEAMPGRRRTKDRLSNSTAGDHEDTRLHQHCTSDSSATKRISEPDGRLDIETRISCAAGDHHLLSDDG